MESAEAALELAGCEFHRRRAEMIADLEILYNLLVKWQRAQNLVSRETLTAFWTRHVADSLQILKFAGESGDILDLGSGGGFPALPMAIALKGSGHTFTLVEANARKAAFLRTVARELGLDLVVANERIERFVSRETPRFALITARALAPLSVLCGYAHPLWAPETRALFAKGREHVEELAESHAAWQYDVVIRPSVTDRSGVILDMRNLRPNAG